MKTSKQVVTISVAVLTALSMSTAKMEGIPGTLADLGVIPGAYAAEDGHSSHEGGSSGGRRGGGQRGGGGGHDSGHDTDHTDHDGGPGGHDSGADGDDGGHSGAVGSRGNSGVQGGGRRGGSMDQILRGGDKPWAQEGIPEVELGRLNVSRAPAHVLQRAEQEALANYNEEMLTLYSLSAEQAAQLLEGNFFNVVRYDSPLQNLALYRNVMITGDSKLPGLQAVSPLDLAAIFLGSASDKTIPISENTVSALNTIMGISALSAEDQSTLASKAEIVRSAIQIGHGE